MRTMRTIFFPLFLLSIFSGYAAQARSADYPHVKEITGVAVVSKPYNFGSPSKTSSQYDEDRQIIVYPNSYLVGGGGIHLLFPLSILSVAVFGVVNSPDDDYKAAIGNLVTAAQASAVDIGELLREQLSAAIATNGAPQWQQAVGSSALQLSPYFQFTVDQKSGKARLYAVLRAEVPGANGETSWSMRYFARAPGEYNISGNDSWMAEGRISSGIRSALSRALNACISHTHGNLTAAKPINAEGWLPFMAKSVNARFIVLHETDAILIARLKINNELSNEGIHVLDRSDFKITPRD